MRRGEVWSGVALVRFGKVRQVRVRSGAVWYYAISLILFRLAVARCGKFGCGEVWLGNARRGTAW